MIFGSVICSNREEAEFFNSVIESGLLNIDYATKEKFRDTEIKIKCRFEDKKQYTISDK